jgi:uncharacterized membrane protein YgcG
MECAACGGHILPDSINFLAHLRQYPAGNDIILKMWHNGSKGVAMKRYMVLVGVVLALAMSCATVSMAGAQSANNFSITDYQVEMWLDKDSDNRSILKTTETITAEFPQSDQNHGLERVFVKDYDGHGTNFTLSSVTNANGQPLPYNWNGDALRIGEKSTYVHGAQTYKITYSQRDVTKFYQDTKKSEFYWDVIGVEWQVPITSAQVIIHLSDTIKGARQTQPQCYMGTAGSQQRCLAGESDEQVSAAAMNIGKGSGMTMAIGFAPDTFAAYTPSTAEMLLAKGAMASLALNFIVGPIALIAGLILMFRRFKRSERERGVRAVLDRPDVVEYIPPPQRSVVESAVVLQDSIGGNGVSAQLIDWAVRHYLELRQTKEKQLFSTAEYTFTVLRSFDDVTEYEKSLATTLFGKLPQPGDAMTTKDLPARQMQITSAVSTLTDDIKKGGLFETDERAKQYYRKLGNVGLVGFFVGLLNIPLLVLGITSWATSAMASTYINVKGAELKKYLTGLKTYIGVAEEERLKLLQSPEGAEKVGEVSDTGVRIKLYEKVLPYAIMFGQEKKWAQQLGALYEQTGTAPDWSPASTAFSAAMFSSMMSDVNSGVSSASSYSASSGGSGGGGSSGGGGGGGGGGGW